MDKTEAVKKAEELLPCDCVIQTRQFCSIEAHGTASYHQSGCQSRKQSKVAAALLSVDDTAGQRGYAKGVETAAKLSISKCRHCRGCGYYYYGTTAYPGDGPCEECIPLAKAIRVLLTEPVGERSESKD